MNYLKNIKNKITKKNLELLDATERDSKYYLKKLYDWQSDYSDWIEWQNFKDEWIYCEYCKSYSEGQCMCYTR